MMKKRIIFSLMLAGFTSLSAQIVLMRELLVIFYGNELSLGITLGFWLLGTALGSFILARWLSLFKPKVIIFCIIQLFLAFILFLSILGVRYIPQILNISAGEIIGIVPMSMATFVVLLPICILVGSLFAIGCQIYTGNTYASAKIARVYILEATGATIGGLITSLFLIPRLEPLYIISLLILLNLLSVCLLLWRKRIAFLCAGLLGLGFLSIIFLGKIENIRSISLLNQWKGRKLIVSQNSLYGNVAVTKREDTYSMFINGLYDFSIPDELNSEMSVHFPMLEHHNPKRILLIGGGLSGKLEEVLKYPVVRVDYVELDPELINIAKKYLPLNRALDDRRVRIITNMDGRLFIKKTKKKYDVVIINLPEPYTAQLNRFYTKEFYKELNAILKNKGILSFSLTSNPNYISQEQAQLYAALRNTLKSVFLDVVITPGNTNYFLAAKEKNLLTLDWRILMQRLKTRSIKTKYMWEYYLSSELSKERIYFFQDSLKSAGQVAINRDFRPIAYYYDMILWSTFFKYNLKSLFKSINIKNIYISFILISVFLLAPVYFAKAKKRYSDYPILACVAITGFSEIAFQIVTLLSFQVLYGYVYYKLGIILTSFMLGLIFGSMLATRVIEKGRPDFNMFIKTQIAIFIYPLILPILFWIFSNSRSQFSFWLGSNIIFPFLPIIPGLIGGFQFPLANSLYLRKSNRDIGQSASLNYGLDLFGSFLGAALVTIFLLPVIGIPLTCFLIGGINLVGLILLMVNVDRKPKGIRT